MVERLTQKSGGGLGQSTTGGFGGAKNSSVLDYTSTTMQPQARPQAGRISSNDNRLAAAAAGVGGNKNL